MDLDSGLFSVYDFLGYLVPGILFLCGIYFVWVYPCEFENFLNIGSMKIEHYLIFFVICYLLGHLLSFISSMTIEKYSVWSLDFPSRYLLGKPALGFWFSCTKDKDPKHPHASRAKAFIRGLIKVVIFTILLPVSLTDIIVRKVFQLKDQYSRALGTEAMKFVKKGIKEIVEENISENEKEEDSDYFRILYHYAHEKAPNHVPKMENYVALYGFARTITFSFVILFWLSVVLGIVRQNFFCTLYVPIIIWILSFIFYMDFNKFYRKFSVEAFMAACVANKIEENNK